MFRRQNNREHFQELTSKKTQHIGSLTGFFLSSSAEFVLHYAMSSESFLKMSSLISTGVFAGLNIYCKRWIFTTAQEFGLPGKPYSQAANKSSFSSTMTLTLNFCNHLQLKPSDWLMISRLVNSLGENTDRTLHAGWKSPMFLRNQLVEVTTSRPQTQGVMTATAKKSSKEICCREVNTVMKVQSKSLLNLALNNKRMTRTLTCPDRRVLP